MNTATLTFAPAPAMRWDTLQAAHGSWSRQVPIYGLLLLAAVLLMTIDGRTLQGVSVWLKPAKFSLSLTVYFATLAWIAALVPAAFFRSREGRLLTGMAVLPAASEILYIYLMAGLGQPSHFNIGSPLTALAYQLMGVGAVLLVSVCLWLATVVARHSPGWWRDPLVLAVVLGLALTFLLGGGFGGYLGAQSSHWVGGEATDANGLPLVGWSSTGGDLRVAHFFGMHAMQVLPVLGWLVRHRRFGVAAVLVGAAAYAVLTTGTFLQAIAARPLF